MKKILADLSNLVSEYIPYILEDYRILSELDFIFAKALLAKDYNGTAPVFNTDGRIRIRKGRHPLLDPKRVVPIDIHLGTDFDLLIVTGPNTGGKTVSLKTVGLFFTLMGQAGLHIPANDNSELSVFTDVFADIGDEQSIEQNLSTFSSHMTNIVSILEHVNEQSLVLFDELFVREPIRRRVRHWLFPFCHSFIAAASVPWQRRITARSRFLPFLRKVWKMPAVNSMWKPYVRPIAF